MEVPKDIDPQAKVYIEHLTEMNKQLNDQLDNLKQEYSNSMNLLPDLQKAYQEINELKSKIYEVESENDDLQQRLDISLQANQDLRNSKAQGSNSSNLIEYERQIIELRNEINKNKENQNDEEKSRKKMVNDYETQLSRAQAQNRLCEVLNSKLMNAAEKYFSLHFNDIKELTEYLTHAPKNLTPEQMNAKNKEIENLNSQIQKLKEKIKNEKQTKKTLQIGAMKIQTQKDADMMECNQKIIELENVNSQQQNEIQRLLLLNEQKSIDAQFMPKMKTEFVQVTLTDPNTFDRMKEELELTTTQINEKEDTIRELNKNMENLQNKLKETDTQRKKLISKLTSLQDQNETLQKEIQSQRKKNKVLKQNKLQLMQDIDLPPTSIRIRMENEITNLKHENELLMKSKEKLEHLMEDQNKEIRELGTIKYELMSVIEKQSSLFNVFEELLKKQLPQQPEVVEKEIPVDPQFTWDFGPLPDDIIDMVVGISENNGLSTELKVKNIFIVINKWIEHQNASNEQSLQSLEEKLNKQEESNAHIHQCIIESFGLENSEENYDLECKIKEFAAKSQEQENQLNKILSESQDLMTLSQCDSIKAVGAKFKQLNEDIGTISNQLKEEKNKRNALHQRANKVLSIKEHEFNNKEKSLTKMNENSRNQINVLQEQVDQLTNQNKKLIDEINALHSTHGDHLDQMEQHRQAFLENAHAQSRKIDELSQNIESSKKEIAKWQKAAKLLEERVEQQKKANLAMKKQYEDQYEEMVNANEKTQFEMQKQIQDLELTRSHENNKNQQEIQKLNDKLGEKESQLEETTQKLKLTQFEIEKAQLNANSMVEAAERSKKLAETKYMAKILSLESTQATSIEAERRKGEKEKRSLIDYFIRNFCKYTDIKNRKIDEENYHHTVKAVKDELEKCQSRDAAIRKLIKAKDDETTEDAFTQYVIKTRF